MLTAVVVFAIVTQLASAQPTYYKGSGCEENAKSIRSDTDRILEMLSELKTEVAELKASANAATAVKLKACPSDFTYIPATNGCYKVVLDNLQWSFAGLRCRSLHKDAHLLFISNATEQNHVGAMLSNYNSSITAHCRRWDVSPGAVYWIGGQRIDTSTATPFVWKGYPAAGAPGDMVEMSYTNWSSEHGGQPDGGAAQPCVAFNRGSNFGWHDWSCSEATCSVCELDL